MRGIVTDADSMSVLIEENPADLAGSPKAWVRLTPGTQVLFRSGEPAIADQLTIGHNVSAWFAGPVRESYPVQATARAIVIEPAATP